MSRLCPVTCPWRSVNSRAQVLRKVPPSQVGTFLFSVHLSDLCQAQPCAMWPTLWSWEMHGPSPLSTGREKRGGIMGSMSGGPTWGILCYAGTVGCGVSPVRGLLNLSLNWNHGPRLWGAGGAGIWVLEGLEVPRMLSHLLRTVGRGVLWLDPSPTSGPGRKPDFLLVMLSLKQNQEAFAPSYQYALVFFYCLWGFATYLRCVFLSVNPEVTLVPTVESFK